MHKEILSLKAHIAKKEKLNQDLSTHFSLAPLGITFTCMQHKIIFAIKIIKVTSFYRNCISHSAAIHRLTLCYFSKIEKLGFQRITSTSVQLEMCKGKFACL